MSTVQNNVLSSGYLRELEYFNGTLIPHGIQQIIHGYSKQYTIHSNTQVDHYLETMNYLIGNPSDIYVNEYGINIQSKTNELYVMDNHNSLQNKSISASSIQLTSSGISNTNTLYVYTVNNLLFAETISYNLGFRQIDTQFIQHTNDTIIDIQCGMNHTLMLTKLGRVYSMGLNDAGQLGLSVTKYAHVSTPILMQLSMVIISIACGAFHNLLITEDNQLLTNGYNYVGQCGVTQNDCKETQPLLCEDSVTYDESETAEDDWQYFEESETAAFSMVDTSSDEESDCYFEKEDAFGNSTLLIVDVPIIVDLNTKIVKVYCGKFHSLVIGSNGKCYTFGQNVFGNLGNGETTQWGYPNTVPAQIELNESHFIMGGSCGENHNLLLTKANEIISFGDNSMRQCSVAKKDSCIPTPFVVDKEKEFGIGRETIIEKVICLKDRSIVFVDPYDV